MGRTVQAFIARTDILREAARGLAAAHVVPIEQGFALLLNTPALHDEVGKGGEPACEEFYNLSKELADFGARCSALGAVAYVETDYWGGEGEQAAMLWEEGEVVYGPSKATLGPINDVLRRMGASRGDSPDQFEAVGLHRYRSNQDWIDQPRYGTPA